MPLEYGLLIAGLVLIAIETVVPGFGIFGIPGILALLGGAFLMLGGGMEAVYILGAIVLVLSVIGVVLFMYLPSEGKWNPFVLWEKQENREGYTGAEDYSSYVGKKGRIIAPLRPAGTAEIEGQRVDVISFGDYIDTGAIVTIVKVEGSKLFVQEIKIK